MMNKYKASQYVCAVLLILSSIVLAYLQVIMYEDIGGGVLMYIAQAFLLAASIFGLDYYVTLILKREQINSLEV